MKFIKHYRDLFPEDQEDMLKLPTNTSWGTAYDYCPIDPDTVIAMPRSKDERHRTPETNAAVDKLIARLGQQPESRQKAVKASTRKRHRHSISAKVKDTVAIKQKQQTERQQNMSLTVSQTADNSQKSMVPEGPHVARCTAVIDLGTQTNEWKGEKKENQKVLLSWEFPECTAVFNEEDGPQPLGRSLHYNASLHEKSTLRKHLVAWRGRQFTEQELKGFSLTKVLGHPCLATVEHVTKQDGSKTDRITSVGMLPKGLTCPDQVNEPYSYSIEEHPKNWDRLPNWVKEQIQKAPEFQSLTNTAPAQEQGEVEETEECPF